MRVRPRYAVTVAVFMGLLMGASACGGGNSENADTVNKEDKVTATPAIEPTGNGVAELRPDEILDRARAASTDVKSVHMKGDIQTGTDKIGLDLQIAGTEGAKGTMTIGGNEIEIIRVGTTVYFKGDRAFWSQFGGATTANLLADKYMRTTTDNPDFKDLASFTDASQVLTQILQPQEAVSKEGTTEVNGEPAVELSKSNAEGGDNSLFIRTVGKPYVLRLTATGAEPGQIDFTEYDQEVTVSPPPSDQVIDASELGGN